MTRADMFLDPADDPREEGTWGGDEKATLTQYLRTQRLTLEIKCSGLTAEQLATRSVPPSTMSLLGLVRHMTDVERSWFRRVLSGQDAPRVFQTEADRDTDFDGAVGTDAAVAEAWEAWRAEVAYAESWLAGATDMGYVVQHREGPISVREVLVHMVEEYARHNGHADLLRERIDGRIGQ